MMLASVTVALPTRTVEPVMFTRRVAPERRVVSCWLLKRPVEKKVLGVTWYWRIWVRAPAKEKE